MLGSESPSDGKGKEEMRLYQILQLLFAVVMLTTACTSTQRTLVERHASEVRAGRIYSRDSLRLPYHIEVIRTYHPTTGRLEREEVAERGEVVQITQQLRDTIYVTRRDTIIEVADPAPPRSVERAKASTRVVSWIVVAVLAVCVTILVTRIMRERRR